jgi:hypothetical protein
MFRPLRTAGSRTGRIEEVNRRVRLFPASPGSRAIIVALIDRIVARTSTRVSAQKNARLFDRRAFILASVVVEASKAGGYLD